MIEWHSRSRRHIWTAQMIYVSSLSIALWRPLGRPSVWGAPLRMIVGRPLSAPGAYLQFGDGTPLADNHYETSCSWGLGFSEMKLCAYLFYIQLLRCMLVQLLGKTKRIQRELFWSLKSKAKSKLIFVVSPMSMTCLPTCSCMKEKPWLSFDTGHPPTTKPLHQCEVRKANVRSIITERGTNCKEACSLADSGESGFGGSVREGKSGFRAAPLHQDVPPQPLSTRAAQHIDN